MEQEDGDVTIVDDNGNEFADTTGPLVNSSPALFAQVFNEAIKALQSYGWYIIIGCIICYCIYTRFRSHIHKWIDSFKTPLRKKSIDPENAFEIQQSIAAARQRMQEKVDVDSQRRIEREELIKQRKREEAIQKWDEQQQGRGHRLAGSAIPEPKEKKLPKPVKSSSRQPLRRPGNNPLSRPASQPSYRPSRNDTNRGG